MNKRTELRVCMALLRRDFRVLTSTFYADLIDGTISLSIQYLLYCIVFPSLGMPAMAVTALFWGNVVFVLLNAVYEQAMRLSTDITFYKRTFYFTTLPLTMRLFVVRSLIIGVAEMACATLPIMVGGPILFARYLPWQAAQVPLFLLGYVAALWLSAALALIYGFKPKFSWVRDNMWIRGIMPLAYLSPIYYALEQVWGLSRGLGVIFLVNPYTYVVESFRAVTVASPWISPLVGMVVISGMACLLSWYAYRVTIARLDAVVGG